MNQISFSSLANFNSAVPWGLWVGVYVWLVGISAGAFLLVMWGNLKNNSPLKKVTQLGVTIALAALMVGLVSIQIDLGHIERFYKLFTSPSPASVMAWMVWLYGLYFVILAMTLLGLKLKKKISKAVSGFAALFALGIIVVESLLFALPPGKLWHSIIFPIHFLTSSLVSAIAALILAVGILWNKEQKKELLNGLARIALPIIVINLIVEIFDVRNLALLSGNIIAIALLVRHTTLAITFSGAIGLADILLSKYKVLILAQTLEPFKGFGRAYIEPRLQFSYSPSIFEYIASVFLVGSAICIFYFLYKLLPLTREE